MKSKLHLLWLSLLLIGLVTGCADKKESTASCSVQLDKQEYSAVSSNTNCSSYERASAYLGLAGVTFANFLKEGASDNMVATLGVTKLTVASDYTSGNRGYVTKALCLVGADSIKTSSRCSGSAKTRSVPETEISMFANIADLVYVGYGVLDSDLNGKISTTENNNFSNFTPTGSTNIKASGRMEVKTSSTSYIAYDNLTKCVPFTDNYTVDPSSGDTTCATLGAAGSITEVVPIFMLDNMTDITGNGDLSNRTAMVSELTSVSAALDGDFASLGIPTTNDLRKSLSDGLSKMDNGAKNSTGGECTALNAFDLVYLLGRNAADNSTTSANYKNKNLLSVTELNTVDSNTNPQPPSGLPNTPTMTNARLIYATNTSGTAHTDSYEKAHSALYTALKNVRSLDTEASVKGDGKVSFRELLCMSEN